MSVRDPRAFLESLLRAAVAAADPLRVVPPALADLPAAERTVVVGAGKAALGMARAVAAHLGDPVAGAVVVPRGCGGDCPGIAVLEAGHPVPDEAGVAAARRMLELASGAGAGALVLCLLSGGGSALMTLPGAGLTLADKQAVTRALLRSGAPIAAINRVRRHLSAIKGGRLAAAAWPARVATLAISDVPGDDPAAIASGPTVVDPTTSQDACEVLSRFGVDPPPAVRALLADPAAETPRPGDPRLAACDFRIVASARTALDGAATVARAAGVAVLDLGDAVEGEARRVAARHAALVREIAAGRGPLAPPCVVLSGGETSVTLRGRGRGGRNREYLLALAVALDGLPGVHALAADTDGIDGDGPEAGATIGPDTLARARARGLDPVARLDDNDAGGFFAALGDALTLGPTGTNVNDFRAIWVSVAGPVTGARRQVRSDRDGPPLTRLR